MARTDIHAPAAAGFNPENYAHLGVWDLQDPHTREARLAQQKALEASGVKFASHQKHSQCGHCGAGIRYAALLLHENKEMIWVGETCLDTTFESTRAEFRELRKLARDRAAETRLVGLAQRRLNEAARAYPALEVWLDEEDWNRVARRYPAMVRDIRDQVWRRDLSERQLEAASNAIIRADQQRALQEELLSKGAIKPLEEGKQALQGVVKSLKWQPGPFGSTLKMLLVNEEKGYKVWITADSSLKAGQEVSLVAHVTPSKDDPCFGIGKRPSKLKVLS